MPKNAQLSDPGLRSWDDTPVNAPANPPKEKPAAPTEPFRVVVARGDAILLEETVPIERNPVGALPKTRPVANAYADAFGVPHPTTAYHLDHNRVTFLVTDSGDPFWIRFTAVTPYVRPKRGA